MHAQVRPKVVARRANGVGSTALVAWSPRLPPPPLTPLAISLAPAAVTRVRCAPRAKNRTDACVHASLQPRAPPTAAAAASALLQPSPHLMHCLTRLVCATSAVVHAADASPTRRQQGSTSTLAQRTHYTRCSFSRLPLARGCCSKSHKNGPEAGRSCAFAPSVAVSSAAFASMALAESELISIAKDRAPIVKTSLRLCAHSGSACQQNDSEAGRSCALASSVAFSSTALASMALADSELISIAKDRVPKIKMSLRLCAHSGSACQQNDSEARRSCALASFVAFSSAALEAWP